MIKELYETLTLSSTKKYTIQKDKINRIKVFHNKGSLRILIQTYIIVVLPIILNFSPLDCFYGTVDFRLENTIDKLIKLTHKLQSIQGKRVVKGKVGAEKLKNALTGLF